ncbi:Uncharacterised protein [Mycobacteroides abscessus subsp. abscessus]|nr:Uncharacterised protein [Mycobacteroides abscessus subsp. abscessus]
MSLLVRSAWVDSGDRMRTPSAWPPPSSARAKVR